MGEIVGKNRTLTPLFDSVKAIVENSRNNIRTYINSEIVIMYWNIGKLIKTEILKDKRADYGKQVLGQLSSLLNQEFGKGYSIANLSRMLNQMAGEI